MRQVSLWSQPEAFAVRGVEEFPGVNFYQRVLKLPERCALLIFFPCFLGFVLSPGSGLSPGSHSIALLASSEEQVMAEVFTASPLLETDNQMLQAGQK